jgi:hypothetical protein
MDYAPTPSAPWWHFGRPTMSHRSGYFMVSDLGRPTRRYLFVSGSFTIILFGHVPTSSAATGTTTLEKERANPIVKDLRSEFRRSQKRQIGFCQALYLQQSKIEKRLQLLFLRSKRLASFTTNYNSDLVLGQHSTPIRFTFTRIYFHWF